MTVPHFLSRVEECTQGTRCQVGGCVCHWIQSPYWKACLLSLSWRSILKSFCKKFCNPTIIVGILRDVQVLCSCLCRETRRSWGLWGPRTRGSPVPSPGTPITRDPTEDHPGRTDCPLRRLCAPGVPFYDESFLWLHPPYNVVSYPTVGPPLRRSQRVCLCFPWVQRWSFTIKYTINGFSMSLKYLLFFTLFLLGLISISKSINMVYTSLVYRSEWEGTFLFRWLL